MTVTHIEAAEPQRPLARLQFAVPLNPRRKLWIAFDAFNYGFLEISSEYHFIQLVRMSAF